jgi:hypothetical protein
MADCRRGHSGTIAGKIATLPDGAAFEPDRKPTRMAA